MAKHAQIVSTKDATCAMSYLRLLLHDHRTATSVALPVHHLAKVYRPHHSIILATSNRTVIVNVDRVPATHLPLRPQSHHKSCEVRTSNSKSSIDRILIGGLEFLSPIGDSEY